jgi:radical SAM protein with 4Fe4S-binding SPASM domain
LLTEAISLDPRPHSQLHRLPLVTLYLTERCNSRCVTCDYWRHGRADMNLGAVTRLLPSLKRLHTDVALISGGEPLLNPDWPAIAQTLRDAGIKTWLLTSGLSLAKHARRATQLFDAITVSMDGTDRETYQAIRGLDAWDTVCEGIRAAAGLGLPPSLRVTLQRANYRQLPGFVLLAKVLGAREVSFLAVDVANAHAFGRTDAFAQDLALLPEDLPVLDEILAALESAHADDFESGFIAESPRKLRHILQYFAAIQAKGPYPHVRCNAPEFSAVVGATGNLQPCFFISGPAETTGRSKGSTFDEFSTTLNHEAMRTLRASIRAGDRAECKTCVCSMWREPPNFPVWRSA